MFKNANLFNKEIPTILTTLVTGFAHLEVVIFTTCRKWVAKGAGTWLACVETEAAKAIIARFVTRILSVTSQVGTKATCTSFLA